MLDIVKMLMPKIIGVVIALIIVLIAKSVAKKYADAEYHKPIKTVANWLMAIIIGGFIIHVVYFASVNCFPRSCIDKSAHEEGIKNMQDRYEKEASKPKQ